MSQTVNGSIVAAVNLTTQFGSGTAGGASETNNLGAAGIAIAPGQPTGLIFADAWSATLTLVASTPQTFDLTALVGVRGGTITLAKARLIVCYNCDPTAGHDVKVGPGASNGFAAPWDDATAYNTVKGGMSGAGIPATGLPVGTPFMWCDLSAAGSTVDSTHKTITVDPGANNVSNFVILIAG